MCICCECNKSGYANRSLGYGGDRCFEIERDSEVYYLIYYEEDEEKYRVPIFYCPLCGLSLY